MAKDFLDELLEALQKLKDEEVAAAKQDWEAGLMPAIPMTPTTVLKKVNEVVRNHRITPEEMSFVLNYREPSAENARIVREYAEKIETE